MFSDPLCLFQKKVRTVRTLEWSSRMRYDAGCPWMLPVEVVRGVFMSAWASTHTTHSSFCEAACPKIEPIARLGDKHQLSFRLLLPIWSVIPCRLFPFSLKLEFPVAVKGQFYFGNILIKFVVRQYSNCRVQW